MYTILNGFSPILHCTLQWLSFLPFNGRVDLKNPQYEFHVLEDYGNETNSAPDQPLRVFFGRLIAHGQRRLVTQYAVKRRHFIANTSMDAQLSLVMANQALVCTKLSPVHSISRGGGGGGGRGVACNAHTKVALSPGPIFILDYRGNKQGLVSIGKVLARMH